MDRNKVNRLIQELVPDGVITIVKGSGTKYTVIS